MFSEFLNFLGEHASSLQEKTLEHISLVILSLFFASVTAIPLGITITHSPRLRNLLLNIGSVSQTIPSLAMLAFLVPFLGLGTIPTITVLTFYAIYPILRSTYTGILCIPAEYIEAAEGLGFSSFQRLWWIELPLALPVLISGMRLAVAMTIGIATIAAFIGAGGLGDFITQGLSLNDSSLILLGAIPTALLALAFDYAISHLESYLQHRKEKPSKLQHLRKLFLASVGFIAILCIGNTFVKEIFKKKEPSIVIASKNFTEQYVLAELLAQLIESNTSLKVVRKFNLGSTNMIHQAMLKGEVDLYPEYSGTAYITILKETLPGTALDIFNKVKATYKEKFDFLWLNPFGFSNSQSLALPREYAHTHQIHSLTELAKFSSHLTIAAPPEFLNRADAFPGLKRAYGLSFKKIIQVEPNLMYAALRHQKADVVAVFTTDGKIQKFDLEPLKDDKNFYLSYLAAPVIRQSTLEAYPEIYQVLSPLLGILSQEKIKILNEKVDREGISPSEVARQFLSESDLI